MKRISKLSACLVAIACCVLAAEPSGATKKGVLDAEKAWVAACIKADAGALEKLLASDLSYTHSSGKTQTKADFIQDATGGATTYKSIEFENTKVRQYGTTAIVTHTATITSVPSGTSHLYITEVWADESGHWLMVSRQASKLP